MIPQSTCAATARAALLHPLLLLGMGLVAWPDDWETIRTLLDTARSPEASRPGREGPGGYYVELIGGMDGSIRSRFELANRLTETDIGRKGLCQLINT